MNNKDINIALFGLGTVGKGFYQVIARAKNAHAHIRHICVRSLSKPRGPAIDPTLITDDPEKIFADKNINLIVEVINDPDAAFDIVSRALRQGIDVVTGNKAMLAAHLPRLIAISRANGAALLYDASSCGSIPVIRNLEEYYDNDLLLEVKGILNASTNYILSRVFDHGEPYALALQHAQQLGFAESDPTRDISGADSRSKLVIITLHAMGVYVTPDEVFTVGISNITEHDIQYAREKGYKIKLVAQVVKVAPDRFTMFVMPEFVGRDKYIYAVDDEYNGVVIRGECYERQFMFGKGAGALPTASSILSDVMARRYDYRYEYKKMAFTDRPAYTADVLLRVYVSYATTDVSALRFREITERYQGPDRNYLIGTITLADLIATRPLFDAPDVFLTNLTRFFS